MNDFNDQHTPTPEFRASLERDIARAFRRETQFDPAPHRRTWRIGTIIGVAAGAVFTLTVGLVLGASTGYASAEEILKERGDTPLPSRPALAVLKNIPPLVFTCSNPVRAAQLPQVQQGIPIIELPSATARSTDWFRGILGLRQVSNGNLLVNDAGRRQMKLLDSSLALQSIVRDSAPGSATSYGPRIVPLHRYLGDSSLMAESISGNLLIFGPTGQVARAMAPTSDAMMTGLNIGGGGVDDKGRILYGSHIREQMFRGIVPGAVDSALLVRVDLDTRRADTLARMRVSGSTTMVNNGTGVTRFTAEPLPVVDEWALLSDGSIAVVRGHDYHIDWIHADGTSHSTSKLPFDWKRLTDEDKQKIIDSARVAMSAELSAGLARRPARGASPDGGTGSGARGGRGGDPGLPPDPTRPPPVVEYVAPALKDMPDYYPSIRRGAVMPDLDGNLWILPTSSAQSKNGELVYDVVNVKGDFHRVRVPAGRSIAGFGKGGVVYLNAGDKTSGFYLEKTKLPAQSKTASR
jgi:hypothetical protein